MFFTRHEMSEGIRARFFLSNNPPENLRRPWGAPRLPPRGARGDPGAFYGKRDFSDKLGALASMELY